MSASMPPPEWAPQAAIWTAWPSAADLWEHQLVPARSELAAMVAAIATAHGPQVRVLAQGAEAAADATARLGDQADVLPASYGDIWLRDTGPIFGLEAGQLIAHRFRFNGWGEKYQLPGDESVGDAVAVAAGAAMLRHDFVLEGGAVDWDGAGTLLTTRQCLLNANRNPGLDERAVEEALAETLGARKVLWLEEGLRNDHTDGHIDNLARFVGPAHIVCQEPWGPDDPNRRVLHAIHHRLSEMRDAAGQTIRVTTIPSPGLVVDDEGQCLPASHMNFLITDRAVVVPTYGTASAAVAVAKLAEVFPGRRVVGRPARAILSGGGAFHCITQQQPGEPRRG